MKCIRKCAENIDEIAEILREGKVVVLPTDTVYGFSGIVDLKSSSASYATDSVIRSIKGRSETKPLIELIASPSDIKRYTDDEIPSNLLEKWPGPLTIIVNIKKDSPLSSSLPTVAFRCPGDEWLRKVIEKAGSPIFSTSVNRSGKPVLSRIDEIKAEFGQEVEAVIDDGDKLNGVPSTIVSVNGKEIKVLRQGAVII